MLSAVIGNPFELVLTLCLVALLYLVRVLIGQQPTIQIYFAMMPHVSLDFSFAAITFYIGYAAKIGSERKWTMVELVMEFILLIVVRILQNGADEKLESGKNLGFALNLGGGLFLSLLMLFWSIFRMNTI